MSKWSEKCCVCLEKVSICKLPCSHHVCEDCAKSWLPKKSTCPLCRRHTTHVHLANGRIAPVCAIAETEIDRSRNWISDFLGPETIPQHRDCPGALLRRIDTTVKEKVSKLGSDSSEVGTLFDQFNTTEFLLKEKECAHPDEMSVVDQEGTITCTGCGKVWKKESNLETVFLTAAGSDSVKNVKKSARRNRSRRRKKKDKECINRW